MGREETREKGIGGEGGFTETLCYFKWEFGPRRGYLFLSIPESYLQYTRALDLPVCPLLPEALTYG